MTADERDGALRARFRALAEAEASLAPPFVRPAADARRFRRRPGLALGLAVVALVLAVLGYARWTARTRPVPCPIDLAAATWTGPTDFLLATPGDALLRDVPTIEVRDGTARAAAPGSRDDTLRRNRT
jgi:hypothetical protein